MGTFIQIAQLIVSLSILVLVHEFGHFIFAKGFKARVEKFYLFFNPWFSIFKIKRGETEYGLGWLPVGGYVKIAGMMDESMDKEQMKQPPQPYEFRAKPTWQRLLIMIGGVLFNIILAFFIYIAILYAWGTEELPTKNLKYGIVPDSLGMVCGFKTGDKIITVNGKEAENYAILFKEVLFDEPRTVGIQRNDSIVQVTISDEIFAQILSRQNPLIFEPRIPFIINGFSEDSNAKLAGLQEGDKIIGLNGDTIQFFDEFKSKIQEFKSKAITVKIDRKGEISDVNVLVSSEGLIGVLPLRDLNKHFEINQIDYTLLQAIPAGFVKGYEDIGDYLKQLKLIFQPKTGAYKSVGSVISIGNMFPKTWDWRFFWSFTAFLSIALAVLNILPIPALDGGHVVFLIYEMVAGRKPSDKFMEYAQIAGMVLLVAILILALGNDIIRHIIN